jgi:hypothetical protein
MSETRKIAAILVAEVKVLIDIQPAAASPFVMLGVAVPRRDSCRSRALILP